MTTTCETRQRIHRMRCHCGLGTLHFEVDVVLPGERRRGVRLRGLGNLRELRREASRGSPR